MTQDFISVANLLDFVEASIGNYKSYCLDSRKLRPAVPWPGGGDLRPATLLNTAANLAMWPVRRHHFPAYSSANADLERRRVVTFDHWPRGAMRVVIFMF